MNDTNCPNCGAPITGDTCPYCGTEFARPEEALKLALGRRVSVSFEADGHLYEFDMVLDSARISASTATEGVYSDGMLYHSIHMAPEYEADLSGRLVASVKHGCSGLLFCRRLFPEEERV